ncbi:MAG TPA: hypothetical protein VGH73_03075 [Thermoanaerobaculia bacterium]|jgi:hypothetical protein
MRKFIFAGTLLVLALGCSGGHSPTEPGGGSANRGNWIGTITGTHAGIHLQGTCTLEMNLDVALNGQWWVDCPGASSRGQVLSVLSSQILVMTLTTESPASSCPWVASGTATVSTVDATFHVVDCGTHQEVSSGTLHLMRR